MRYSLYFEGYYSLTVKVGIKYVIKFSKWNVYREGYIS